RTQLHLFERDSQTSSHHHLGITVDDLEPVYRAADKHDAFDRTAFRNHLVHLPGDVVQLYIRDPAGNLVEIDQHGADRLPDDIRAQLRGFGESREKREEKVGGGLLVPACPAGFIPWEEGAAERGENPPRHTTHRCRRCAPLTSPASP